MVSQGLLTFCTCVLTIILAVGLGLFGGSFALLELNNVGLLKNKLAVTIEQNTVYKPGRYFVGLSGTFITYPTTYQRIKFSNDSDANNGYINVKSSNSTQFQVGVTIYYRFKIEFLHNLFQKYPNGNQQRDMMTNAQQVIQVICSNNTLDIFFNNREQISTIMTYAISSIFRSQFFSEVTMFLLGDIVLNDQFEQSILNSQISARSALTQLFNQSVQNLAQSINNINTTARIQINSILATAQVTASQIYATNASAGDTAILTAMQTAMSAFMSAPLSYTGPEVSQLFYLDQLGQVNASTVFAGFADQNLIITTS
jgi:hypothetical protein